ncbi:hypothetical protein P618_200835 [Holospora obtusa F1]|uniref:Uncharacterized protein n=1 Tax=Holospora obtusa F1 TaxID=1399147 RepID=W6TT48_HOLOB|nr:hypothetical protein P618_200835 [Holospora obtusa F1]
MHVAVSVAQPLPSKALSLDSNNILFQNLSLVIAVLHWSGQQLKLLCRKKAHPVNKLSSLEGPLHHAHLQVSTQGPRHRSRALASFLKIKRARGLQKSINARAVLKSASRDAPRALNMAATLIDDLSPQPLRAAITADPEHIRRTPMFASNAVSCN